jgi:hypothetical protein
MREMTDLILFVRLANGFFARWKKKKAMVA